MNSSRFAHCMEGKVALVTGGTRGIGLAIAKAMLLAGAKVVISGRSIESIGEAGQVLTPAGDWAGRSADLEVVGAPEQLVGWTLAKFGSIDVLVNNAGIAGPIDFDDINEADWDRVQAINLRASFFCARGAADAMKRLGKGGSIVNVSSVAGQIGGAATGPAYVASKAGLIGLTKSMARRFASDGIRVNCLTPSAIETDMTAQWPLALKNKLLLMTPLSRLGNADEVADAALFLASSRSSYLTGQTLNVNGGLYMGS